MRVLYVSDVYFPRVNGVSTSIATFRADLAACGVESTLVAPDYPGVGAERGIVRIPASSVPGDPEDRRMRWRALTRALRVLAHERFDLVHVQTPFIAHYAGVRHARAAGLPCVATYHTYFAEYLHHYAPLLPRLLGRTLARAFTRSQCRQVDALIAPSEPLREILHTYGVTTPIHVLPTGLPAHRFARGDGNRFRALARLPSERPLLLYVGRVAHEKNIAFLLHAYARIRASVPQALLVIAGEGPAREGLTELAQRLGLASDVCFVGYLDRDRTLLDCYAAADAFVFASRTETQGLVLLEAMAQGIPVISTAVLGTRSVLEPGSGALVVEENLEDFAAAAVRLLLTATLRSELARRARAYAERWSSLAMAQRLTELYADICRARPATARAVGAPRQPASSAPDA
ncbi:MAG TPA: glycosyltransferase [Steroidobacteraceae bacterium]|nr:glycosyltransferase [Steroidobacteraceae bacterium]